MIRLIASDLDETLLDSSHRICERNRRAVAAARELGVRFVPCTGRPGDSVAGDLEVLGLAGRRGEYVISFNGGVITENCGGPALRTARLDHARADALYRRGTALGLCVHVYTLDTVWVANYVDAERVHIEGRMNIRETSAPTLDFLAKDTVVKVLYMSLDMAELRRVAADLAAEGLSDGLDVAYSSNRYLEFNAPGVNKGAGLMELAARLGIAREEVMAIGDNSNDVPMLRAAGLGVAVANASEEARAAAGYVCEADNDAGGVAEAIERFVLGA